MFRDINTPTLAAVITTLLAACAAVPEAPQEGTVSAIFVEPLPGILLSPALTEADAGLPRWVEVRFDPASPDRGPTLARVDAHASLDIGDRVVLQPGVARPGIDIPILGIPGLKAFRTTPTEVAPVAVASVQGRTLRIEVMPP
jgi:hypothetical protein